MKKIIINNARILDPATKCDAKGSVLIHGPIVKEIALESIQEVSEWKADEIIDAKGLCLCPGFVDMRVQTRSSEVYAANRELGHQAAFGGVTSLVCVPNDRVWLDNAPKIHNLTRSATSSSELKAHFYCYGALTQKLEGTEMSEIGLMLEAGAVGFTDGTRAIGDARLMHRILLYASNFNALIIQHPEEPSLSKGGQVNAGVNATRLGLQPILPQAESIIIERDLHLLQTCDVRYHVSHISTQSSLAIIQIAKNRGVSITCDSAPAYFHLDEDAILRAGAYAKIFPPLRTSEDKKAIAELGFKKGIIDCLASDHIGCSQDEKRLPFALAEPGASGLETLLPLTLDMHASYGMSLLDTIALITHKPAQLLGIGAGQIAVGSKADLVLFDPNETWRVNNKDIHLQANPLGDKRNTPFDKFHVKGKVKRTWVCGRTVFCE